ncbi:MAG: hypothetical protein EB147_04535 [Acidimicrobiia bacterium]|nr:hypothetical protein [Acidimicrobiia bacterium]
MPTTHDRRWWARLGLIAGLGAIIRVAFTVLVTRRASVAGDQIYYSAQALTNSRGKWFEQPFQQGMPSADHPPLTSLILTPITWLTEATGSFVTAQRLMMVVVGISGLVIVALLAREVGGSRVGLIAASITAVYANIWVNDGLLMAESPTFLLVGSFTLVAMRFSASPSVGRAVTLGALVGLMALTRAELLLALPIVVVLAAVTLRPNRKEIVRVSSMVIAATVTVLIPWVVWNQVRFENPVFLSTNDGLTLAGANCDRTYYEDVGSWDIWCAYHVEVPENADASEASALMRDEGLRYWSSHAKRFPVVAAARVARVMSLGYFSSVNAAGEAEGRPTWVSVLGALQFWVLVPLAFVGFRASDQRSRRWLLLAFWPIVLATVVIANAYVRFRVPAEVGLIVLAAAGVATIRPRSRSSFEST